MKIKTTSLAQAMIGPGFYVLGFKMFFVEIEDWLRKKITSSDDNESENNMFRNVLIS